MNHQSKTFISVIIPVYYEDAILLQTIEILRQNAYTTHFEIIVVDTPQRTTIDTLELLHVKTITASEQGRAYQMNAGAQHAKGEILLFLHADTLLPKHWDSYVRNGGNVGAFKLSIHSSKFIFKAIETLANVRTSLTNIPYGDQAHFFKTAFFKELGGYGKIPLMEDIEIMKRIKQKGNSITLLKAKVLTSPRRWEKEGILYTTLRNRILSFLYWCGVSPKHLVKRYKPHTK